MLEALDEDGLPGSVAESFGEGAQRGDADSGADEGDQGLCPGAGAETSVGPLDECSRTGLECPGGGVSVTRGLDADAQAEITGKEKASDVFNNSAQNTAHYKGLFGKATPASDAEADFFRGIGYLHLGVQHLRNEKAHTPASPLDPNLAVHYISLASLAYDLITRYVSEDTIQEIEDLVLAKRRSYRSATAFYNDFENGKWLKSLSLPVNIDSSSVRNVLKKKWLEDADFTRSWDHSNVVLMQLELVAVELTPSEIDQLLDLPTRDSYGNDQEAGMLPFLEFIHHEHPDKLSPKATSWIASNRSD